MNLKPDQVTRLTTS